MVAPAASAWRRLMSAVYEAVILFGVVFFFGYGYSALTSFRGQPGTARWGFMTFLALVLGVYFTYFWSDGRRTLPMKTMSVQILGRDDRPIGRVRALARYLVATALMLAALAAIRAGGAWFALLFPIPFAWAVADRDRRALYDVIVGTRLAVVPIDRPAGALPAA